MKNTVILVRSDNFKSSLDDIHWVDSQSGESSGTACIEEIHEIWRDLLVISEVI